MPTKSEEQKAIEAEVARKVARDKETDEQKWMRGAIREAVEEVIDERLNFDGGDGDKPKTSGGPGFLETLFGKKPA